VANLHPHLTDLKHKIRIRQKQILAGSVTSMQICSMISIIDMSNAHTNDIYRMTEWQEAEGVIEDTTTIEQWQ